MFDNAVTALIVVKISFWLQQYDFSIIVETMSFDNIIILPSFRVEDRTSGRSRTDEGSTGTFLRANRHAS